MLAGVTDPVFVFQRINASGLAYPFTFQARNQTEFTGDFKYLDCTAFKVVDDQIEVISEGSWKILNEEKCTC